MASCRDENRKLEPNGDCNEISPMQKETESSNHEAVSGDVVGDKHVFVSDDDKDYSSVFT